MAVKRSAKRARLYHFSPATIAQIDVLAVLYGGNERAVSGAINATYQAAGNALSKMKVKLPKGVGRKAQV